MMVRHFEHFIAIDWSGAVGERHRSIAVALAHGAGGPPMLVRAERGWSRAQVLTLLRNLPEDTLVGMDLGIALPHADAGAYFPGWDESPADARALWRMIDAICTDDDHFAAGSFVNHPQAARYFRHSAEHVGDRFHLPGAATREGRFRVAEAAQRQHGVRPVSNFNLVGAAQVGKSSLTGMRVLHALDGLVPVWPIDPLPGEGSVIVEIYTSIAALAGGRRAGASKIRSSEELDAALTAIGSARTGRKGPIDDHSADALITAAWMRENVYRAELWSPAAMTGEVARTEGWTFGVV